MRISDVLPVPFGPSTASNSPRSSSKLSPSQSSPLAEAEREPVDRDDGAHRASAAASARACPSCHCWNVSFGGSVSVTPTTGMPACARGGADARVMGETAWLL